MKPDRDLSADLRERLAAAHGSRTALRIRGGGTKDFYGCVPRGELVDLSGHAGIVGYEPTELVVTARAGTALRDLEDVLQAEGQMLAFEPPAFGVEATLGGTVACNLSGPRRAYAGAARDFVLGTRVINGRGEILGFGGEVMKNVAGYDVSRLMTGALGTLGMLLEVSLKVLPRPESEITLAREATESEALNLVHAWARTPIPLSATCWIDGILYARLSGEAQAVTAASRGMGGDRVGGADRFWTEVREHQHEFFLTGGPLWRLSVISNTPPMALSGRWVHEWGGSLRWLDSGEPVRRVREAAAGAGGHAVLFRGATETGSVFHPLPDPLMVVHRRLKQAFDPERILNPGRMYSEL